MKSLTIKIIILLVSQVTFSQNRYSETTPSQYNPSNNSSSEMDYYLRKAQQKATALFNAVETLYQETNSIISKNYESQLTNDMYIVLSELSILRGSTKLNVSQAETYYNRALKSYNKAIKRYNKRLKKLKKE